MVDAIKFHVYHILQAYHEDSATQLRLSGNVSQSCARPKASSHSRSPALCCKMCFFFVSEKVAAVADIVRQGDSHLDYLLELPVPPGPVVVVVAVVVVVVVVMMEVIVLVVVVLVVVVVVVE